MKRSSGSNSYLRASLLALQPVARSLLMAGVVSYVGAAAAEDPKIQTFPSPYMAAKDAPLKTIAKGATVNAATESFSGKGLTNCAIQ